MNDSCVISVVSNTRSHKVHRSVFQIQIKFPTNNSPSNIHSATIISLSHLICSYYRLRRFLRKAPSFFSFFRHNHSRRTQRTRLTRHRLINYANGGNRNLITSPLFYSHFLLAFGRNLSLSLLFPSHATSPYSIQTFVSPISFFSFPRPLLISNMFLFLFLPPSWCLSSRHSPPYQQAILSKMKRRKREREIESIEKPTHNA